jgi:hypothetical protein
MKAPAAFSGLFVRLAMRGFPLAASPAKGKIYLCVLGVSAVIIFCFITITLPFVKTL